MCVCVCVCVFARCTVGEDLSGCMWLPVCPPPPTHSHPCTHISFARLSSVQEECRAELAAIAEESRELEMNLAASMVRHPYAHTHTHTHTQTSITCALPYTNGCCTSQRPHPSMLALHSPHHPNPPPAPAHLQAEAAELEAAVVTEREEIGVLGAQVRECPWAM